MNYPGDERIILKWVFKEIGGVFPVVYHP